MMGRLSFVFILSGLFLSSSAFAVDNFVGNWKGDCTVTWVQAAALPKRSQTTGMTLTVSKPSNNVANWQIQYTNEPARNYVMRQQAGYDGHFVLDEGNGFLIDRFIQGELIFDQYEIQGARYSSVTHLKDPTNVTIKTTAFVMNRSRTSRHRTTNQVARSYLADRIIFCNLKKETQNGGNGGTTPPIQ